MKKIKTAEEALEMLASIDTQTIQSELEKLRAIREWAVRQAWAWGPIYEGTRVALYRVPTNNGWAPFAEALADGALATVKSVDFNRFSAGGRGLWHADVVLDREWSYSDFNGGTRWWHGPADETPDGYVRPSDYDIARCPDGRKHTFSIPLKYLEPVNDD